MVWLYTILHASSGTGSKLGSAITRSNKASSNSDMCLQGAVWCRSCALSRWVALVLLLSGWLSDCACALNRTLETRNEQIQVGHRKNDHCRHSIYAGNMIKVGSVSAYLEFIHKIAIATKICIQSIVNCRHLNFVGSSCPCHRPPCARDARRSHRTFI